MISVCLASYNGEKYIREQVDSILTQLPNDAELIISDDGSTDSTIDILRSYDDKRLIVLDGPHEGVVKNFEYAIGRANGDYIFLSDQDDVWKEDKVEKVIKAFSTKNCKCVLHDAIVVDADEKVLLPSFLKWRRVKHGLISNLMKNSYTGCCMALSKDFRNDILPFPEGIAMHDWWIGLLAEKESVSCFIDDKLILYRRHGENTNSLEGYSMKRKIHNRLIFIKALL